MSRETQHGVLGRFQESADIETASEDYARRFAGPVGRYFLDIQTRLTLELLGDSPNASVLDVGGGHAQLALPLVQRGYRVTVTGSHASCRDRLDRLLPPGSFTFRRCDMLELPFDDREFDVALAFRLLAHVERWQGLLAQMCRVARRAVIVDYPDRRSFNSLQSRFFGWKRALEKDTRRFRCFSRQELLTEFDRNGFDRPSFRPEFFIPMVVHRSLRLSGVSAGVEAASRALGLTRLLGSPVILRVNRVEQRQATGQREGQR